MTPSPDLPDRIERGDGDVSLLELEVSRTLVDGKVLNQLRYLTRVDDALTLVAAVERKHKRPFNLVIAAAYGKAYVCPNDGQSYGINDPLKGEAHVKFDDISVRLATAITIACLRSLAK